MPDAKPDAVQQLLKNVEGDIQAIYTRYQEEVDKIAANEQDFWLRSHKLEISRAKMILEKADLEVRRHSLIRNMATMNAAKPIAGINLNVN